MNAGGPPDHQPRSESLAGRQGGPGFVKRILRPIKRRVLIGRMRLRCRLQQRGIFWLSSAHAKEFARFKRARARLCPADLSALQVPAEADLVSVVLPVYNGERYVREALDSVLAQTWERFELIVVDDGSTDSTPAILAEYAGRDPRVRIITQANQKLPRALNTGFRAARGEFLTWTSADNRLKPAFLENMVACLKRHPGWDMIYANEDLIDEAGRPLLDPECFPLYHRPAGSHHIHFPTDASELNTAGENFVGAAFMYRARVPWLIGEYDPERFGLEDYDYWMRINALLTLRHADFDKPVYEYRLHGASLTSRAEELGIEAGRRALVDLDRCRRELYLAPPAWRFEAEPGQEACVRLATALRQRVTDVADSPLMVYVKVTASLPTSPPREQPATSAINVLLLVSDEPVPAEKPMDWDLCVVWSSKMHPQHPTEGFCGWMVTNHLDALLAAMDIGVRSCRLPAGTYATA